MSAKGEDEVMGSGQGSSNDVLLTSNADTVWFLIHSSLDDSYSLNKKKSLMTVTYVSVGDEVAFTYNKQTYSGIVKAFGTEDDYEDLVVKMNDLNKKPEKADSFYAGKPRPSKTAGRVRVQVWAKGGDLSPPGVSGLKRNTAHQKNPLPVTELVQGSNIFVNSKKLSMIRNDTTDARKYARRLLGGIFTKEAILACSLKGKPSYSKGAEAASKRPALDEHGVSIILSAARNRQEKRKWRPLRDDEEKSMRQFLQDARDAETKRVKKVKKN